MKQQLVPAKVADNEDFINEVNRQLYVDAPREKLIRAIQRLAADILVLTAERADSDTVTCAMITIIDIALKDETGADLRHLKRNILNYPFIHPQAQN